MSNDLSLVPDHDHDAPTAPSSAVSNPLAMLQVMVSQGADPVALGKMMDLAERWQAGEAKRRWAEAIEGFRSELLPVAKRNAVHKSEAKGGGLLYHFASYADVKTSTSELERKYGIVTSYSFEQGQGEKMIGTLKVTVGSHTEITTLPIPIAQGQNTNSAQNYGLTVTYCKRYLYCAAFDIIVRDADTDGRIPPTEHDNPDYDPTSPVERPRNQRRQAPSVPSVSKDALGEIAFAWKELNPDAADHGNPRDVYLGWLRRTVGRQFDVSDLAEWTLADVAKCRAALGLGAEGLK